MRGNLSILVTCDECGAEIVVELESEGPIKSMDDYISSELRTWHDWGAGGPDGDLCSKCRLEENRESE